MDEIKIDIKTLKKDLRSADIQKIEDAIYIESAFNDFFVESQITVSGKYNREYKIVAFLMSPPPNKVLTDDDKLIICLWDTLLIIDLKADKLMHVIEFDGFELFRIFKFKSGYFIHGEMANYYLNKNFDVVWECGSRDIFFNPKVENILEIFDDYVTVFDWCGYKNYYNENGEFKSEYYHEYDFS